MIDLINYLKFKRNHLSRGKYWGGGMGLHPIQCELIQDLVKKNNNLRIIEFGSGNSTQLFSDLRSENQFELTSIDHDFNYAWKGNDARITLLIRPLRRIQEEVYDQSLSKGYCLGMDTSSNLIENVSFRTPRVFYDLRPKDLPQTADLVVIDGPNGNGRLISIAVLHNILKIGSYVLIDDVHHYPFEQVLSNFFEYDIIARLISPSIHPLFGFGWYKITGIR